MPQLHFTGKSQIASLHRTTPPATLSADAQRSSHPHPHLADNLIIQGDNLAVLKALCADYAEQVACIYIDPPYNTGAQSWAYNDNVNSPQQQEWLRTTVGLPDLSRHDKWLCMIYPRLKLLHALLRAAGVLVVSIDDNEVHHLRLLLDEVFGEEQFIATMIWQKVYSPRMDSQGVSVAHDYLLVYGKSPAARLNPLPFHQKQCQFPLLDPTSQRFYRRRSLRKEGKDSLRADAPSLFFPLVAPDGSRIYPIKPNGVEGRWRWARATYAKALATGKVEWLHIDGQWQVYVRQYMNPAATSPPETLWRHEDVGHNHEAQEELATILGPRAFVTPKPTRLIRRVLALTTRANEGALVLDAFAGSGTTGHAVLAQNAADGGNRRFILIEQAEYAASLTAERVQRVISGVPGARDPTLRAGYGGGFSFFRAVD